nr:hypothetical protein Iba_chr10eCG8620 [Ipomoea batatas]
MDKGKGKADDQTLREGLIPPSKSQESLSLTKDWSEIQNWYATHDGEGRELPRHPRVEEYDKDYVQYLDEELEIRDSDEEDSNLSSIQEEEFVNAPRGPGYAPRAPTYDSDTIEWYRFFDEVSLSAREVQCPPIPENATAKGTSTSNALEPSKEGDAKKKRKTPEKKKAEPSKRPSKRSKQAPSSSAPLALVNPSQPTTPAEVMVENAPTDPTPAIERYDRELEVATSNLSDPIPEEKKEASGGHTEVVHTSSDSDDESSVNPPIRSNDAPTEDAPESNHESFESFSSNDSSGG